MASGMSTSKRFAVRTALVTGSTLAVVVGTQALLMVDAKAGTQNQNNQSPAKVASAKEITSPIDDDADEPSFRLIRRSDGSYMLGIIGNSREDSDSLFNTQQTFRTPRTHSSR